MLKVEDKKPNEANLIIDFSTALNVWDFDHTGKNPYSYCMKAADYLVEWDTSLWLLEIKDPENPAIEKCRREAELDKFSNKLTSGKLIREHLAPKAKDSFLYLYLTNFLKKPLKYLTLLCISSLDTPMLLNIKEQLEKSICADTESKKKWSQPYFTAIGVFNITTWNYSFPKCPAARS